MPADRGQGRIREVGLTFCYYIKITIRYFYLPVILPVTMCGVSFFDRDTVLLSGTKPGHFHRGGDLRAALHQGKSENTHTEKKSKPERQQVTMVNLHAER